MVYNRHDYLKEQGGSYMGIIASRNLDSQRREENGEVYFDRGTLEGRNGRKYARDAIQTHFVQRGEDQAELVRR